MSNLTPQFKITISILFLITFWLIDNLFFAVPFAIFSIVFGADGLFDLLDGEK